MVGHSSVDQGPVGGRNPGGDVELGPERRRRDHRQQGAQRHLQNPHRHLRIEIS